MASQAIIDPTKAGKYPVILSDALLGKASKETYTGVRYNHRPALSSDAAPHTARLKKSAKDDSYNLGFDDQGNRYQYNGVRTTDDGNFVLIFDPARKAFVLHQVDSTFHMNLTRTPTDSNVDSLRKQFPHLEVKSSIPAARGQKGKGAAKAGAGKATAGKAKDVRKTAGEAPKANKKPVTLTLPDLNAASSASPPSQQIQKQLDTPAEPERKPKRRALSPVESEEEEDDDDDGGLTVEYPGGNPSAFQPPSGFSPAFPVAVTRRFSEFARDIERESEEDEFNNNNNNNNNNNKNQLTGGYEYREDSEEEGYEEGDEFDGEEEDEPTQQLPPPKPFNNLEVPAPAEPDRYTFDNGDDSDADGDDDVMDLEAELEREFDKVVNGGNDSDSSVSEEE
ncbi:hypothetical protein N0V88_003555 [Collariella sp. IMI 366227]|nr:hypothetical protein N0V88_003555 [Collariella sp. IMI 366227]